MQRKRESVSCVQENKPIEVIRVDSAEFSRKGLKMTLYKHPQRIKEKENTTMSKPTPLIQSIY